MKPKLTIEVTTKDDQPYLKVEHNLWRFIGQDDTPEVKVAQLFFGLVTQEFAKVYPKSGYQIHADRAGRKFFNVLKANAPRHASRKSRRR